ncbi:MAG: hypothetical protein KAS32_31460, partial [Candidatus Peribacteraceae bacterium]|nr:hypothetical protein [Candidatus Peribacteraceae bacterium]
MKTKDEKEIERLKENMSDLKFTIFTGTVFICILFGVLAFGIHNNQGFIKSNSDMINQYADEVSLISGYEEVYDYETVEKYELWEPPTIEFCEDEYIHDEVCEYMSFTCSYLLE